MKKQLTSIEKKERRSVFGIVATVLISVYAFSLIFPLVWTMYSSFIGRLDFKANPVFGLPEVQGFKPENFI